MKTDTEYAQERPRHGFFSSSYHRHFEGYAEYEATNEKGEAVIRRVYTGMYYIPELSGKQRVLHRLVQGLFWMASWAVFLYGASRQEAGNDVWYVGLCQAVDIGVLVWIGSGLFNYLIASPKMTVGEWRGSTQRLRRGCACGAAAMTATGLMTVLNLVLTGEGTAAHLGSTGCFLLAALCMALSWRKERRIVYSRVPSEEHAPGFAAQIR